MALMKFMVIGGPHTQRDPDGRSRTYQRGQVFESETDMVKKYPNKFQRVMDDRRVSRVEHSEGSSFPPVTEQAPQPLQQDYEVPQPTQRHLEPEGVPETRDKAELEQREGERQQAHGVTPPKYSYQDLNDFNVEELQQIAQSEGIQVKRGTRKDTLMQMIVEDQEKKGRTQAQQDQVKIQ